jgi:hypothetical protein
VRCPVCLFDFQLSEAADLVGPTGEPQPDRIPGEREDARRDRLERVERVCPGSSWPRSPGPHTLPYRYDDPDPIVLGIIGARAAGKSHLLAAMVYRLLSTQTADRLGIRVTALYQILHQEYLRDVRRFVNERRMIPVTQPTEIFRPADILEIHDANGRRHTLVVFDVDGESLQIPARDLPFLVVANALIFVADPEAIRGLALTDRGQREDPAFGTVTDRILAARDTRAAEFTHVPTALVVAKADLLTFRGSVLANRWMAERTAAAEEFDLATVGAESEDVWTYLSALGGEDWLAPVRRFAPATLHFASATGTGLLPATEGTQDRYFSEAGFRQIRVLKPLLTLLGAHGVAFSAGTRGWAGLGPTDPASGRPR